MLAFGCDFCNLCGNYEICKDKGVTECKLDVFRRDGNRIPMIIPYVPCTINEGVSRPAKFYEPKGLSLRKYIKYYRRDAERQEELWVKYGTLRR